MSLSGRKTIRYQVIWYDVNWQKLWFNTPVEAIDCAERIGATAYKVELGSPVKKTWIGGKKR